MGRTSLFRRLRQSFAVARLAESRGLSTDDALGVAQAARERGVSRRDLLGHGVKLAGAAALAGLPWPLRSARAAPGAAVDCGIVGAGLAGLAAADALKAKGTLARVYEAGTRVGGRCFSLRGHFPGQVAERGGELIDNLHKVMLGYAKRFGNLAKADLSKEPGEVAYYFRGAHVPEATIVDELRDLVARMHDDLTKLSGGPTADASNDFDKVLDHMDLRAYLTTRGAGPNAFAAIEESYLAEYGREIDEQSSLNFLFFIHADRRSKFTPFGVFSDERYHLRGGNDAIASGLAGAIDGQIEHDMRLTALRRQANGRYVLTFQQGSRTIERSHDAVILAIPFTVLRTVELDASLGLPLWKTKAIDDLGYGDNAKLMVGFSARPWVAQGSNGSAYSDLANHQTSWETNAADATATRAIITDYSSGARGRALDTRKPQVEAERFVADLDRVYPGAAAAATRVGTKKELRIHLEHWPSNPLTKGSYTCYLPGQFTTIAGNEGKPVEQLYFAGEHADSFYSWQGFMEGACLSGLAAADQVLRDAR